MFSRRRFLHTAAAGAVLGAARGAGREHLREFTYADVQLTGGPLKAQHDWVHAHFLSLDNDRLLKVYRQRAGLPAPGDDRSEEHTSELQSLRHLVCRLLLA